MPARADQMTGKAYSSSKGLTALPAAGPLVGLVDNPIRTRAAGQRFFAFFIASQKEFHLFRCLNAERRNPGWHAKTDGSVFAVARRCDRRARTGTIWQHGFL
jgi:hypothetical protein